MILNIPIFQWAGIIGSLVLIVFILDLVRRRKLGENYSLLWLGIALVFFLFSLSKQLLLYVANVLGVYYAPAALFLILIVGLYMLSVHFSLIISGFREKITKLSQESALLKEEIEKLKENK